MSEASSLRRCREALEQLVSSHGPGVVIEQLAVVCEINAVTEVHVGSLRRAHLLRALCDDLITLSVIAKKSH